MLISVVAQLRAIYGPKSPAEGPFQSFDIILCKVEKNYVAKGIAYIQCGSWTFLTDSKSETSYLNALYRIWDVLQKAMTAADPNPKSSSKMSTADGASTSEKAGRAHVQDYTDPTLMVNRYNLIV